MTKFDEIKNQIETRLFPVQDGKITKFIKMSPELCVSMKKLVDRCEKKQEEILELWTKHTGLEDGI